MISAIKLYLRFQQNPKKQLKQNPRQATIHILNVVVANCHAIDDVLSGGWQWQQAIRAKIYAT